MTWNRVLAHPLESMPDLITQFEKWKRDTLDPSVSSSSDSRTYTQLPSYRELQTLSVALLRDKEPIFPFFLEKLEEGEIHLNSLVLALLAIKIESVIGDMAFIEEHELSRRLAQNLRDAIAASEG